MTKHSDIGLRNRDVWRRIQAGEDLPMQKQCTACQQVLSLDSFYACAKSSFGRHAKCRSCHNVEVNTPEGTRRRKLKYRYNIRLEVYSEMLAEQDGKCAACGLPEAEGQHGVLHVDHDHDTGDVRALLCHNCNRMLGMARESKQVLRGLMKYLDDYCGGGK